MKSLRDHPSNFQFALLLISYGGMKEKSCVLRAADHKTIKVRRSFHTTSRISWEGGQTECSPF